MACVGFHALKAPPNQSVLPSAFRIIRCDTEVFDDGGFYDPVLFRWTPPAGLLTVRGCVSFSVLGTDDIGTSGIFKNGILWKKGCVVQQTATNPRSVVAAIDKADGDDFYELVGRHNGAASDVVFADSRLTYFSGASLGECCFPTNGPVPNITQFCPCCGGSPFTTPPANPV